MKKYLCLIFVFIFTNFYSVLAQEPEKEASQKEILGLIKSLKKKSQQEKSLTKLIEIVKKGKNSQNKFREVKGITKIIDLMKKKNLPINKKSSRLIRNLLKTNLKNQIKIRKTSIISIMVKGLKSKNLETRRYANIILEDLTLYDPNL